MDHKRNVVFMNAEVFNASVGTTPKQGDNAVYVVEQNSEELIRSMKYLEETGKFNKFLHETSGGNIDTFKAVYNLSAVRIEKELFDKIHDDMKLEATNASQAKSMLTEERLKRGDVGVEVGSHFAYVRNK